MKTHEILTVPTDNNDDGREITSNIDYQRSGSLRDVDLENFKNEMLQIVRQEIQQNLKQDVAQNSEQASNANVLENFKNEMIQVVKQEMETLRQDAAHDSGQEYDQVSGTQQIPPIILLIANTTVTKCRVTNFGNHKGNMP
ncbi:7747_t:CDS:2 [Funneliformis mosseae]|uniref:7747_t:CDS:1 n=1 Tax=Funneliformis mosseae TaxID=27381 RepID=A0A9N8ZGH9_FUNMO|nr:7747_t:CDS:2 [Funneliformis mosseae]